MLKYFKNTFSTAIVNRGDLVQVRLPFGTQLGVVLDRVGIYDGLALRPDGGRIKFKQRDVDLVVANWLPVTADSESKIVNKVLKLNTSARNLSNSCKSGMAKVYGKLRMRKVVKLSEIGKELFGEGRLSTEQLVGTKLALQSGMYFVMVTPVDCQMDPCYNPRHPKEVKFLLDLYQNKHEKEVGNFVLKAKNLIQDYRQGLQTRLEFSAFEKSLIRLMKSAIKIPKTISEVEMLICSKLVLSKLKMDDGKKPVSIADVQLFLKEIGVFSENEDMALHAYSPQGTLDNLELISWIGDEIIGESSIHAENLLDGKSKDVGFSSRGLLEIKAKTIGKTAADATFFRQDPFIKLRTSVDRPVFAIDSEYAHEIDDAVSMENDWIHVHIADPTSYIPHHHPLSQLAQLRANSVYLPHRHFPLMPNILSDDLFNLGVSNFALTFSAKLNDGGDIVDYKVEPSYLNNVKRLTYTNVDTVLDWTRIIPGTPWWAQGQIHKANTPTTGGISTSEAEILKKIQDTTWKHRQRRLERNAIIQDQFANNVRVLEAPVPVSPLNPSHSFSSNVFTQQTTIEIDHNSIPERSPSSILVQEAMIIAGRVAAKFCHDRKLNVAYRCQNSPIVTVEGRNAYDLALSNRHGTSGILPLEHIQPLFPYMESAYMSNTPNAHSSLGLLGVSNENQFPGYLKVTSPLRRYQDMVVHYQIGNFLLGKKPAFTELEVRDITTYTENLTKRGNSLSKRSVRYWVLEYLRRSKNEQDCIEKIYDGVVMYRPQSAENKFHVSIPELAGLAAQCISTTPYVAGQRITIRIEKADPLSGQAIFKAI